MISEQHLYNMVVPICGPKGVGKKDFWNCFFSTTQNLCENRDVCSGIIYAGWKNPSFFDTKSPEFNVHSILLKTFKSSVDFKSTYKKIHHQDRIGGLFFLVPKQLIHRSELFPHLYNSDNKVTVTERVQTYLSVYRNQFLDLLSIPAFSNIPICLGINTPLEATPVRITGDDNQNLANDCSITEDIIYEFFNIKQLEGEKRNIRIFSISTTHHRANCSRAMDWLTKQAVNLYLQKG